MDNKLELKDAIQIYLDLPLVMAEDANGDYSLAGDGNLPFVQKQARDLVIINPDTFKIAAESVQMIKGLKKTAEDRRKAENEDYNERVKKNNARYKPFVAQMDDLLRIVEGKMSEYTRRVLAEQEAARKAAEEQARIAEEAARKAQEEYNAKLAAISPDAPVLPWDLPIPPVPVAVVAPKPAEIERPKADTTFGGVGMRESWKCEIISPDEVPAAITQTKDGVTTTYALRRVDDVAVGRAVRGGVREIPGVRIWNEFSTAKART